MVFYKAEIKAQDRDAETLATLISETLDPAPAVSTTEKPGGWLIEVYFDQEPDQAALQAIVESHPTAAMLGNLELEAMPDEDWVALTQRGLHPVVARRFFIHGSHDRARARGKRDRIEIDAAQAFGTAHHGTTRGCLMMLDSITRAHRVTKALDLGTGTGILAIAAAKALRAPVLATDIDPVAVRVARENIALNGESRRITAMRATGLNHPGIRSRAPFDLVMANILSGPLIGLASAIRSIAAPRGHLILSGILDGQAAQVRAAYRAQGFIDEAQISVEQWTTLHLRRRS